MRNIKFKKEDIKKNTDQFHAANSNIIMRRSSEDVWNSRGNNAKAAALTNDYALLSGVYGFINLLLSLGVIAYLCTNIFTF